MPIEADIIHLKKNPVRLGILNIFKQIYEIYPTRSRNETTLSCKINFYENNKLNNG